MTTPQSRAQKTPSTDNTHAHTRTHAHTHTNLIWSSFDGACNNCPVHREDQIQDREEARWRNRQIWKGGKQRNLYLEVQSRLWFLPAPKKGFVGFSHGPVGVKITSKSASTPEEKKNPSPSPHGSNGGSCHLIPSVFGRFTCFIFRIFISVSDILGYETISSCTELGWLGGLSRCHGR